MNSHEDFHKAVDLERETLTRLSNYWNNKIKGDVNITGDTKGRIRAAVGKTRLLLAEKFKQFEGLLEQSENNTSEKEISFNDLQGFWELVLLQVNEVKEVFRSFGPATDKINSEISESLQNKSDDHSAQKAGTKGSKTFSSSKKKSENGVEQIEQKLQDISGSNKKRQAVGVEE